MGLQYTPLSLNVHRSIRVPALLVLLVDIQCIDLRSLSEDELKILSGFQLLTLKPLLIGINFDENSIDDVEKLERMGCEGVIIGKALYENKVTLKELGRYF